MMKTLMYCLSLFFLVCPPGKFKHRVGEDRCQTCPEFSNAPYAGSVECRCQEGYYRALKDEKSAPCTRKYTLQTTYTPPPPPNNDV